MTRNARAAATPKTMLEEELLEVVLDCAATFGWLCYHPRPARTRDGWRTAGQGNGAAGFPDVTLARRGRVVFAELKSEKGAMSVGQVAWQRQLMPGEHARAAPVFDEGAPTVRDNAVEWYLWRPSRWFDGTIAAVLR